MNKQSQVLFQMCRSDLMATLGETDRDIEEDSEKETDRQIEIELNGDQVRETEKIYPLPLLQII